MSLFLKRFWNVLFHSLRDFAVEKRARATKCADKARNKEQFSHNSAALHLHAPPLSCASAVHASRLPAMLPRQSLSLPHATGSTREAAAAATRQPHHGTSRTATCNGEELNWSRDKNSWNILGIRYRSEQKFLELLQRNPQQSLVAGSPARKPQVFT